MAKLCFITVCKGRLAFLRQTLGHAVSQPDTTCVVVDYDCPERTGDWVAANYPQVHVVRVTDRPGYNQCHARNLGARAAETPWLCFCDADVLLAPSFAESVLPLLRPGHYYRADPLTDTGLFGTFVCARTDFERVGGYDEVYQGWGDADMDLYQALGLANVRPLTFPASLLRHLPHSDEDRVRFYANKNLWLNCCINRLYRTVKFHLMRLRGQHLGLNMREQLYQIMTKTMKAAVQEGGPRELSVNLGRVAEMPDGWGLECSLMYRFSRLEPK